MKPIGRSGLFALLTALLGLACEPAAPPAKTVVPAPVAGRAAGPGPEPARAAAARGLCWRAEIGSSTLYLLGSVHVARPDIYPLDPRIEGPFAQSDVLVLELSLDEAAQVDAARRMMELGRLAPGQRLSDVVQPETWTLLERLQAERGRSMFGLRGFRPWFVALTLTTQSLEGQGFSADNGIDEHFRRAAQGHKRIEALETVESQLGLFASLTPAAEEQLLRQTLEEVDEYATELDAAFRLWSAGDAPGRADGGAHGARVSRDVRALVCRPQSRHDRAPRRDGRDTGALLRGGRCRPPGGSYRDRRAAGRARRQQSTTLMAL